MTKSRVALAVLSAICIQACGRPPNRGTGGSGGKGGSGGAPEAGAPGGAGGTSGSSGAGGTAGATCSATFDSSFAAIEKLIFERRGCTAEACHGSAASGKLDLRPGAAYENLVDAPSTASDLARVQPGTAVESFLFLKLKAAAEPGSVQIAGSPMPVGLPPLTQNELTAVKLWILKGAPEKDVVIDPVSGVGVGALLDACLPPSGPIITKPLDPPGPEQGIQFLLPSYLLKSKSEVENCTPFAFDFTNQVPAAYKDEARGVMFVNGTRVRQDPQSHHLLLLDGALNLADLPDNASGWTCREGERDGQACDPKKGSLDCGASGVCAYQTKPGLGGMGCEVPLKNGSIAKGAWGLSKQVANTQAPQEYLPPLDGGVYSELPLKGVFYFNSHAFNLTTQDTTLHARVNYYYTADRRRELAAVDVIDKLSIAHGQAPFTRKTYCATYVVPRGNSLAILSGHTHRHGERFWVNDAQGKLIYDSYSYNDPVYKRFEPWLDFDAADSASRTLEYCATYNNGVNPDNSPNVELVTRASRMPDRTACTPVGCVAGKPGAACTSNRDCDSAAGANDGSCDACPITAGVTTENEMFVLMPWFALPERAR
jgi:hypothetical protein